MDSDFGYSQNNNGDDTGSANANDRNDDVTNIMDGSKDNVVSGDNADDITVVNKINNGDINDVVNGDKTKDNKNDAEPVNSDTTLQPGTSIEVGNETYTVDDSGNVIDKNGNVFKEAKDVKQWLASYEDVTEDYKEGITINSIREAVGIEITDDNDNPVAFENTPNGIKEYINAVVDTAKEEHFETAINTLYQKYPILNDVLNYYIANNNSLEGFNEIPDRSNITVEESNEAQQEAIIRTAWAERGQKGNVDGYIEYLKSAGTLYATAKEELSALQEADEEYRKEIEADAERKEQERIKNLETYWNGVHEVIKNRSIAGYRIPESIIINRNGQKLSVTPEDFFNYIYRVDKNGKSAYERALEEESAESRRDDEILRAYLKFVGGNYSNLVDMAINKEKVNKLKLKAKERNMSTIRITKPKSSTANDAAIDLGYN